ncbi:group 3 secretory phospholipase A2 [Antrostomus carolinensis]|uniref:group 3 secretory phospholipase A2 n=1 Tax=Antrostomus carolinensis TaxID=279965 RepID=UPI0010A97E87|nr:group 3 secretory phospholipase A2 [Antrostomus carolinensis]
MGSPALQPRGRGRKSSRVGRKRLQQGLGQNPGLHQAWRPVTAQQPRGLGTLSPVSARDEAEPTSRHPAAQRGLEPSPPAAVTMLEQDQAGGRVCRCYKHLDQCKHQIEPHRVKYQLHNTDTRMLFHCNCTRRLARFLHRARCLSAAEVTVLADHIAMDCFVLKPPTDCSLGEGPQHNCLTVTQAVLVPAQHLKKPLRRWGPPQVTSKVERPDWKTQDSGGSLYEQCLWLALEQKPDA